MKRLFSVILAAVMICASLAGCGSKAQSGASSSGSGEVDLTFYAYGFQALVNLPGYEDQTQNLGDIYNLIIDEFEAQNPGVNIKLVTLNPAGGGTEQMDVDLASGEKINIYYDSLLRIAKYNTPDNLLDFKSYLSTDTLSDYIAGSVETDRVWYLPTGSSSMCLCINKDIFDKIGATDLLPAEDNREWTVDQYVAALQAVKDANLTDVYPTILWAANQSGDACNMSYLWGFGARFFNDGDYSKMSLNSPEGYQALEFLNSLQEKGLTVPGAAALNDDDMWAMWQNGQVAITGGYPYLEQLAQEAETPFNAYFVNYPSADGQNPPVAPDTHAVAVFKSDSEAENEMAAKFADFLTSSDWAVRITQALGDFTVRTSMEGKLELSTEYAAAQKIMMDDGLISYGPACAKWSELRPLYASELQAMFSGSKTSQQAVDDFVEAADRVLAD